MDKPRLKLPLNQVFATTNIQYQDQMNKADKLYSKAVHKKKLSRQLPEDTRDMAFLQAKIFLLQSQKIYLDVQSLLLAELAKKYEPKKTDSIEVISKMPSAPEFEWIDHIQSQLKNITQILIELTLATIELYIKRGLYFSSEALFDEVKTYGDTAPFHQRIDQLRRIVKVGKNKQLKK